MIVKFLDKFGKLVKSITSIAYIPVDVEPVENSRHLLSSGAGANISSNIAPDYTKTTYPANSYVMQGGVLYTNSNAIETAEDWNPAHWTQTTIPEVIDDKIDEVTLDPSAVALGNVHLLDEVASFAADAKILVDSETNGPGAMPAENLLELTAQNALGSIHSLNGTATAFASDDYIAIDGATNGSRKLKNDSLLNATAKNIFNSPVLKEVTDGISGMTIEASVLTSGGGVGGSAPAYTHIVMPISPSSSVKIISGYRGARYSFFKDYVSLSDKTMATGYTGSVTADSYSNLTITAPADANFLYLTINENSIDCTPVELYINGKASIKDLAAKTVKLENLLELKYSSVAGKYIGTNGKEASSGSFSCTDFVRVFPGASIYIVHANLNANASLAFYDEKREFLSVMDETGISHVSDTDFTVVVPSGCHFIRWSFGTAKPTTAFFNSLSVEEFVDNSLSINLKPLATLVDDDSVYNDIPIIKSICDDNGIKCSFAVIYTTLQNNADLVTRLQSYQEAGFNIIDHPQGTGWGESDGTFNLASAEEKLVKSLIYLKGQNFLDCEHFVAPGGYVNDAMLEMVSKWCKSGIGANTGVSNHLYGDGPFNIHRLFVSTNNNLDYYKDKIDAAYAENDWLILGTHSNNFETQAAQDLLSAVIAYAKTKGFVFKTYNKAWKDRELVYKIPLLFK